MQHIAIRVPVILGIAGLAVVATGARQARAADPLAPDKYKNIQVLKEVPARRILATMDYFSAATGYGCVDCHQRGKPNESPVYEIDTPRKNKAREMVRMVNAFNAANYGVTVTCVTCHGGHHQPAGLEMMTAERWAPIAAAATAAAARAAGGGAGAAAPAPAAAPAAPAPEPTAPSVEAVVTKYFDALGGRAAVEAMPAILLTASIANVDTPQKADVTIDRRENKFLLLLQSPGAPQPNRVGFDGASGWIANGPAILDAADRTVQKIQALAMSVLSPHAFGLFSKLTAERPQTIRLTLATAPTAVNVLTGSQWPDVVEHLYFDAATGLLVRRAFTTHTALGGVVEDWTDYGDYQTFSGVKLPRMITQTTTSNISRLTVSGVAPSTATDDGRFARPKGAGGN